MADLQTARAADLVYCIIPLFLGLEFCLKKCFDQLVVLRGCALQHYESTFLSHYSVIF